MWLIIALSSHLPLYTAGQVDCVDGAAAQRVNGKRGLRVAHYGSHLVSVTEVYTCFLASCFDPVTLDLAATEDLTGLTNAQKGGVHNYSVLLQGTMQYSLTALDPNPNSRYQL